MRLKLISMKDNTTTTKTETPPTEAARAVAIGLVPNALHIALDAADRGQSTVIAVLHDARIELRTAVDGGLELAEKLAAGALRFSRKLVQKADDASAAALGSAERALANAVKNARETTRAAGALASTAASGVAGSQAA